MPGSRCEKRGAVAAVLVMVALAAGCCGGSGNGGSPKMDSCGAALDPVHAVANILPSAAQGKIGPNEAAAQLKGPVEQLHRVSVGSHDARFRQLTNDFVKSVEGFASRVAEPVGDVSRDGPIMTNRFQALLDYCTTS